MNRSKKDQPVGRTRSSLSVSSADYLNLSINPPSPALSTVTLTPGRIRNIDQDMAALRASRQDNPFIQQVIASRESLIIETLEEESDHTNLMSKDLSIDIDVDPVTLPEMHEHMIRSPPPSMWPKSPDFRAFQFNNEEETLPIELNTKSKTASDCKPKSISGIDLDTSPIRSQPKSHHHHSDRFSLLTPNALRSSAEDSIRLMNED